MYLWGFEREDGPWTVGFGDRVLRFLGISGLLSPLTLPLLWLGYREVGPTGALRGAVAPVWWVWLLPLALFVLPGVLGAVVGYSSRRGRRWVRLLVGAAPAPRGWDQLFRTPSLAGFVRLRLTDGTWLVGVWATATTDNDLPGSYAAGFPHDQDLYFVDTCQVTEDGQPDLDDLGAPIRTGVAALVRWDQVTYAQFFEDRKD